MKIKVILAVIVWICISLLWKVHAQIKFEKEYRIKEAQVPENILQFLNPVPFDKKVKWYMEESQDGRTIEAKTCYRKEKYSIEFKATGELLDIEKLMKWKQLDSKVQQAFKNTLSNTFENYDIQKIQQQWTGKAQDLQQKLISGSNSLAIIIKYEIVLKGKKNGSYQSYELLMDEKGNILKKLVFTPRSRDNIEF